MFFKKRRTPTAPHGGLDDHSKAKTKIVMQVFFVQKILAEKAVEVTGKPRDQLALHEITYFSYAVVASCLQHLARGIDVAPVLKDVQQDFVGVLCRSEQGHTSENRIKWDMYDRFTIYDRHINRYLDGELSDIGPLLADTLFGLLSPASKQGNDIILANAVCATIVEQCVEFANDFR